jgi:hypothetical protein
VDPIQVRRNKNEKFKKFNADIFSRKDWRLPLELTNPV